MRRFLTLLVALFVVSIGSALGQTRQVTGTVVSSEDKQPIPGVNVFVKEQPSIGVITGIDGQFKLTGVPANAKTIVFSFVGYRKLEVPISATLNVSLISDNKQIDEVVVTAMGIKKSEKTLGYASTTIKSEGLDAAKTGSVLSGLSGKVAGVQVSGAGGAGVSQKVLIRGINSLNSNSPLYIVDGVPIDNSRVGDSAADFGNGSNDINSDDVESVNVLKGASATALYGSRASNGVIMITTKRAKNERLTVTYDGAFTASNVLRVMQTQDLFGQGWTGWDPSENGSWGPRLDGSIHTWGSQYLATPMKKPFSYVKHNLRNFYQTGFERNNSLSLSYGTDKVGVNASVSNLGSNGILPLNGDQYDRNTFSLRGWMKDGKFSLDASINYFRKDIRRTEGMDMELLQHAVDIDFSAMKDYTDERFNPDNYYTWYANNPYWMIDNYKYLYKDNRTQGKIEMNYEILKDLKITGRLGGDFSDQRTEHMNSKITYTPGSWSEDNGKSPERGYYSKYAYNRGQIDALIFLEGKKEIGDFSMSATVGGNFNQRTYNYIGGYLSELFLEGWYDLKNTNASATTDQYTSKRRIFGALGQAEIGYKNFAYLNLSFRNDWSSTLPKNDRSFNYGGANVSVILSQLFPSLKDYKIDFLKVRGAIGKTGNDADVYKTSSWYSPLNVYYTYLPFGGVTGLTLNNTVPSQSLKPEMTTEYEFGISANLFDNRVTIDAAYYNKQTKDQIISAVLPSEVGYTSETKNVGKLENQGVEISLNVIPVRTKDFTWEVGANFTKNKSKVKSLWGGITEYTYTTWRGIEYIMKVGEPIGVFRIPSAETVKDATSPYYGYKVVDNNGYLKTSSTDKEIVGASQPDFTLGLNTRLKYKSLSLSILGDWRKGGYMVSNTSYISHFSGTSTQTVYNERNSFVYQNTVKVVNGQYVENNIAVRAPNMSNALGNYSYNPELLRNFIIPRDYFKLREVALTYSLPANLIKKTPFKGISVSLVGRNLLLFTPKENNYVDPEATNLGNDLLSEFGETTGTSSTRNYGGSIKIVF